ncbi:MAG: nucleoside recognition domain-containing protein [Pseudomonadota bacterium]
MGTFIDHLRRGTVRGISGFFWILKILIPVSFFTFVLQASGLLARMDFLLVPIMGWIHLPPEAALPLIIGILTGIYGAIAAMAVLPLAEGQMILIAIFLLISHALIQEGIIQGKSGMSALKATLVRLSASVVTVLAVAPFLTLPPLGESAAAALTVVAVPFLSACRQWAGEMAWLCLKILFIVTALMVVLELMKAYRLIDDALRLISPLLRLLGLSDTVGMMWLAAAIFGISYGGAVIVEESRTGRIPAGELDRLHLSIGINHAMVEDPALFLILGLPAFWLWVPRLVAAVVAVHLAAGLMWLKRRVVPAVANDSQI